METYGLILMQIFFYAHLLLPLIAVVYFFYKKSLRFWWGFLCFEGFFLFNCLRHFTIIEAYKDISNPNYELYQGWGLSRFILSDLLQIAIWGVLGLICYLGFERKNKSALFVSYIFCCFLMAGLAVYVFMTAGEFLLF